MRHMSGSDEIVTYHHVATMVPSSTATPRRSSPASAPCTTGCRPRAGKFYESLAIQPTAWCGRRRLEVRRHHDWMIAVKLGNMEELFAPELPAGKGH